MRFFLIAFWLWGFIGCKPDSIPMGDGGITSFPECVEPLGEGTTHGGSIQDETWTAAGSPHILPYDATIYGKLTLEPCTLVLISEKKTITVRGSLVAHGTATSPVAIGNRNDGKPWATIRTLGGTLDLQYTGLVNGGDPLNAGMDFAAVLDIRADQTKPPTEVLHADHLLIQDSASNGIYIHEGGAFSATSDAVIITGSKGYPIHAWGNLVGTIPAGAYTGNTKDEILITGTGASWDSIASWDVTFHDRGVPYHVGTMFSSGRLDVGSFPTAPVATLTVEPGVVLRFKKGGALHVEYSSGGNNPTQKASGVLIAVGTAEKPILFTSAEAVPTAGDWLGVRFGGVPDVRNRMDFTTVDHAGGVSPSGSDSCPYPNLPFNNAAIRFASMEPAGGAFITNTIIDHSASHGIDRGFRSNTKPDFMHPTNRIRNVVLCAQTYPRDLDGACPAVVPCPPSE